MQIINNKIKLIKPNEESEFEEIYKQYLLNFNKYNNIKMGYNLNTEIYNINKFNLYFDKIIILNLNRRLDRWTTLIKQLKKYNIYNYERFAAYEGIKEPFISEYNKLKKNILSINPKADKLKLMKHPGSYGILKSTYDIILLAKTRNYKSILLLQDDVILIKDFYTYFNKLVSSISSYKLLYFGASQHTWNNIDTNTCKPFYNCVNPTCGAFAVAIDCSIFDEILYLCEKYPYYPIDEGVLKIIQEKYVNESYVAWPNIIIADLRDSDLRNYRSMDRTRFNWDISLYDIKLK